MAALQMHLVNRFEKLAQSSQQFNMSSPTESKQWILTNKPTDLPELSGPNQTFTLKTASLPSLADNQVLLKTLYISNDPAQRG